METELGYAAVHRRIGDELCLSSTGKRAKASDFIHESNVIFIHGFTSHGRYMQRLTNYFDENGFNSFIFNYESYRGIQLAARTLSEILSDLNDIGDGAIAQHQVSLVCHSMGGLVGRAFTYLPETRKFLARIVTLGTPHDGTLRNDQILKYLVKWGEYITEALPGFASNQCVSAQELIGSDTNEVCLLDVLKTPNPLLKTIPILSISGGKPWIEFSRNPLLNALANMRIQKVLGEHPNDGLVLESSSDISRALRTSHGSIGEHYCSYPEFESTNHSNLTQNHSLSLKIMKWLRGGVL